MTIVLINLLMIDFINNFVLKIIFENRLKKFKNNNKINRKINSIGIILDDKFLLPSSFKEVLAKNFNVSHTNIKILVFNDNNKNNNNIKGFDFIFKKDEINLFGNFSGDLKKFSNKKFDLLINYFDVIKNFKVNLLSLKCKKSISIGFMKADNRINDLIFNFSPSESDMFIFEVNKYLNKILK